MFRKTFDMLFDNSVKYTHDSVQVRHMRGFEIDLAFHSEKETSAAVGNYVGTDRRMSAR